MRVTPATDRPAAIRGALRTLVADRGFHGASMSAVARRAGVAAGTAYIHYASKDELVLAAYVEAKRTLGEAAVANIDTPATPRDRFVQMWIGIYDHLHAEPEDALFLVQVDTSPYRQAAQERVIAGGDDPLVDEATRADLWSSFVDLPVTVLYDLGLAPAVRLAAQRPALDRAQLLTVAHACWTAITASPPPGSGADESAHLEPSD
jgi:AcrR family transcriptional regulator